MAKSNSGGAKKPNALSSQAAKILEQYRSAGKSPAVGADGSPLIEDSTSSAPKPPPAPPASQMRRSGTRGK